MSRFVKVSVIAPHPHEMSPRQDMNSCVDKMIAYWDSWLAHVLCEQPDLVVLPEACDRVVNFTPEQQKAFYTARCDRIRDHFRDVARASNCNIAYSAIRSLPDGTWRNSTQLINRQGGIDGIYNKNHLTHGEHYDVRILYGKDAPVIHTDFGRVAGIICFDLNYQELRDKYKKSKPEVLIFSSMYHGGLMQNYWAYACKAFFLGSVAGEPCTVINPVGDLVAQSTNYYPYVTADINLDYQIVHIDYNQPKYQAAKQKYGPKIKVYDPGYLGVVMISSETDELNAADVIREFDMELWEDYYVRSMAERHEPGHIEP